MLSGNAAGGQVRYHTWNGTFTDLQEHPEAG